MRYTTPTLSTCTTHLRYTTPILGYLHYTLEVYTTATLKVLTLYTWGTLSSQTSHIHTQLTQTSAPTWYMFYIPTIIVGTYAFEEHTSVVEKLRCMLIVCVCRQTSEPKEENSSKGWSRNHRRKLETASFLIHAWGRFGLLLKAEFPPERENF